MSTTTHTLPASNRTLKAPPGTDLWRKPPSTDRHNPVVHTLAKIPLKQFKEGNVVFSGKWERQYDQAGMVLTLTKSGWERNKWLKTGVEFYEGVPKLSVVATESYSDWSLTPPAPYSSHPVNNSQKFSLQIRRESDELGSSLWVYQLVDQSGTIINVTDVYPLREVCWFFAEEEGIEVEVGVYAARPNKDREGELEVSFERGDVTEV